jgi:hypothetical protein
MKKEIKVWFLLAIYLSIFHIAFIILMGVFAKYENQSHNKVPEMYSSK